MASRLVAFDIGSTLIHPNLDTLAEMVAAVGLPPVEPTQLACGFAYALEADQRALPRGDRATRQGQEFLRALDPGRIMNATLAQELWTRVQDAGGAGSLLYADLDPDAHIVLDAMHAEGCVLVAASNSDGSLEEELDRFNLTQHFDLLIDSHEIGAEKPDHRFFECILNGALGKGVEESWYVGNDPMRDALGALVAGFDRAVLYDRSNAYPGFRSRFRITVLKELPAVVRDTEGGR